MMSLTLMLLMSALAGSGDESQVKPAAAPAPAQDQDRPALSTTELKALRENNIFAPRGAKRQPSRTDRSSHTTTPTPYRQKAPVVTGIFLDVASQSHQAIVEDKNDSTHKYFKEPKFMKVGDEWAGIKLESITQDKAVFNKGGTTKDVHIGESLPESEEKPLSASEPSEDPVADDGEVPPADAPKSQKSLRPESKPLTPETQSRTLDEMKKRIKKNKRPGDNEE